MIKNSVVIPSLDESTVRSVVKSSLFGFAALTPVRLSNIFEELSCFCENKRLKKKGRKLTYDWYREIKLDYVLAPLYRFKGDAIAKRHPGYAEITKDHKTFCTDSSYVGNYNSLGFGGYGEYVYPHGVKYNGHFKNGHFHGEGTLTYPMGQQVDGVWKDGRLMSFTFRFADGLEYTNPWKYCQQPDRSFQAEVLDGLHAAGEEYLTNQQPTKYLRDGCYDTVDGYFDPVTKCVYKDEEEEDKMDDDSVDDIFREKPEILRVCTQMEEDFIVPNYRKAADDTVGYRPDLYEHWTSGIKQEIDEITRSEKKLSDQTASSVSNQELLSSNETGDSYSIPDSVSFQDSILTN